jgi:hypothetical protein
MGCSPSPSLLAPPHARLPRMPSIRRDPLKSSISLCVNNQRKQQVVACLLDLEKLQQVQLFRSSEGGIPTDVPGEFIFRIYSSEWGHVVSELNTRCLGTNAKYGTLHCNLCSCFRYFGIIPDKIEGKRYKSWSNPAGGYWTYCKEEEARARKYREKQREAVKMRTAGDAVVAKAADGCSAQDATEKKVPSSLQFPDLVFPTKESGSWEFQPNPAELPPISFYMRKYLI